MTQKSRSYERLLGLGYDRAENYGYQMDRSLVRDKNYTGKLLNHVIMDGVVIENCNFTEACSTGSIFRHCKFLNCDFDQADFEFSEFYNCEFKSRTPINCSFNRSSFIDTFFDRVAFRGCTFTDALFLRCRWNGGSIINSTLEGAKFSYCTFLNMDFRELNMDYIEIDKPKMGNVVLPLAQIPFMFGCLQYLRNTQDNVKISKNETGTISRERFWREIVALLCDHFYKTEQFFPLANIKLAIDNTSEGIDAIKKGLVASVSSGDFRMLKYYCKLMVFSNAFQPAALHDLYNNYICRLLPQNAEGIAIPNYARHMMEIKQVLFGTSNSPSFRIAMRTNILLSDHNKLGKLFESIFSLGKQGGAFRENQIEAVLQQNSPLIITIRVTGDEVHLVPLLSAFLSMTGVSGEEKQELPVISSYKAMSLQKTEYTQELASLVAKYKKEMDDINVDLTLVEYYVENFTLCIPNNDPVFYSHAGIFAHRKVLRD